MCLWVGGGTRKKSGSYTKTKGLECYDQSLDKMSWGEGVGIFKESEMDQIYA